MEKIISSKWTRKKSGVAILISDKIDFKTKAKKESKKESKSQMQCFSFDSFLMDMRNLQPTSYSMGKN